VGNLGHLLWQGGVNLIRGLVRGIESVALGPFHAISSIVSRIRNLLPFSPVKTGPLRPLGNAAVIPMRFGSSCVGPAPRRWQGHSSTSPTRTECLDAFRLRQAGQEHQVQGPRRVVALRHHGAIARVFLGSDGPSSGLPEPGRPGWPRTGSAGILDARSATAPNPYSFEFMAMRKVASASVREV
jgi:hypothetical protein